MSSSSSSASGAGKPSPAPPALTEAEMQREALWKEDVDSAFEEGVELAFSRWEALNIGMNNQAGQAGPKLDEFITTCVDWFLDEGEKIHWDDVEGWLGEVLAEEFHVDAQDGSPEAIARLLCTLYADMYRKTPPDFTGMHRMCRTQSETARRMQEARHVGQAASEREHARRAAEASDDELDGEDEESGEEDDGADGAAEGVAGLGVSDAASSSTAAVIPPVEEKTAEQLQDEADGWETVPKKGRGKK